MIRAGRFLPASCGRFGLVGRRLGPRAFAFRGSEIAPRSPRRRRRMATAPTAGGGVEDHGCKCSGRTGRRGRPAGRRVVARAHPWPVGVHDASNPGLDAHHLGWTAGLGVWVTRGFAARLGRKRMCAFVLAGATTRAAEKWCFWRMVMGRRFLRI